MKTCKDGDHGPDCEDEFCTCYCHDEDDEEKIPLEKKVNVFEMPSWFRF